ncbi:MAG TPA: chromate transporter [Dictyobacter sp.]|nr:chromate transporter [Dictyobacter sp.]
MHTVEQHPYPGRWKLFLIWMNIGLQSFGGGSSTTLLIQRTFIENYHWLTFEEYTYYWNLCQFPPGINLIALTILIGKKLGGITGTISALLGLLLPSALVTCLLAAVFKQVQQLNAVQAIIKGVIPATAGISLVTTLNFARTPFQLASKEGLSSICLNLVLIAFCTLAIIWLQAPAFLMIPCIAVLGIACFTRPLFRRKAESSQHD